MTLPAKEVVLAQFDSALQALHEAIETDTGDKKSRDSVLLSYVFTFETGVKSMRKVLQDLGMQVPDYATAVLKAAFQAQLIHDATGWEALRDRRNFISHAYDEEQAIAIAAYVRQNAMELFGQLQQRLTA
jgi:nucleotidyltransferase substrate binding protein (TIGR01987 family)